MAPTYIASVVAVIVGLQQFVGLDFMPEQWEAFLTVGIGLFVMVRQLVTGRATLLGARKK